jgi:hypothetical protein
MEKPKIEDLKFLGMMMGQNAWGNDDCQKIIDWYKDNLLLEIEKNLKLEMENFRLLAKVGILKKVRSFWGNILKVGDN